jgi:hypothetical protein
MKVRPFLRPHSRKTCFLSICCLLAIGSAANAAGPRPDSLGSSVPSVGAVRTEGSIRVDGRLDEPAWERASPAARFTQRDPREGAAVSESTEVRVLIDDEALYVGARLYDREPEKIRARLVRRDGSRFGLLRVFLDGYHDRVNAVLFRVNPLGCVNDAVVDVSGNQDTSWDPVWHVECSIDSLGWVAEIQIPLSQLHYNRGGDGVWGVQSGAGSTGSRSWRNSPSYRRAGNTPWRTTAN